MSRQTVRKWENGDAEPETKKLKRLADAFGVSVGWLLSEESILEEEARAERQRENDLPDMIDRLVQR